MIALPLARSDGRRHAVAVASVVMAAACWGFATVMTKDLVVHVPPLTLVTVQLVGSVAFLWAAIAVTRQRLPGGASARRAAAIGLLEPGLAYALGVHGVALTTASSAAVIGAIEPAMVCVLAALLLRERIPAAVFRAIALTIPGVVLISLGGVDGGPAHGDPRGEALVMAGAAVAALYVVLSSRFVASIDPLSLTAMQQSVGLAFVAVLAAYALASGAEALPADIPASTWLFAAVSGIVQYALSFWFYLNGLRVLRASVATAFLALIPVFGVGGGILFLRESFTLVQWAGCAIVVAAVGLVVSRVFR